MPFSTSSVAIRSGFSALRSNPLRTALSALGVVIGIAAMVAVLALSDGVEASIRKQLSADGRAQTLRLQPRTMEIVDGLLLPKADAPVFTMTQADSLARIVGPRGTVDYAVGGQALVTVAPGHHARGMMLRGTRVAPFILRDHPPVAGRFYTEAEAARGAHVLVISDGLAAALATSLVDSTAGPESRPVSFGPASRAEARAAARPVRTTKPSLAACRALVGRIVTVRELPWQIIGVLPPAEDAESECSGTVDLVQRNALRAPAARLAAYAPAPAIPAAVLESSATGLGAAQPATLVVLSERIEDLPGVRRDVERWLADHYGATHLVGAAAAGGWKDRVDLASYERESEQIRQTMLIFRLLMTAITGISLVVGGVGIMNVLLASVTERTREIGISKAVGARRRDVLVQYLAESVAIAALGAVLGTILGYAVAQIIAAIMRAQVTAPVHAGFSLSTFLVAVGAPLIVGVAFGMYPALRASRLSPIDAIRHE